VFAVAVPRRLSPTESARRQKAIEAVAGKIEEMAGAASEGKADYLRFEELLNELHGLGFFPEISLISAVAKVMV
jgi:hypothetical protein